jgi:hypothetical protein
LSHAHQVNVLGSKREMVGFTDLFHSLNTSTLSRGRELEGNPNRAPHGPLISVTGERERIPLRRLNRLRKVAVLQAIGSVIFYM